MPTTNQITGTSLAADAVDRIIELDAVLSIADGDDLAELQARIATLDPAEFQHILAVFGVQPVLAAVAGDSSGRPVGVWVAADEAVKELPPNV